MTQIGKVSEETKDDTQAAHGQIDPIKINNALILSEVSSEDAPIYDLYLILVEKD
jgi:hypothetical protein